MGPGFVFLGANRGRTKNLIRYLKSATQRTSIPILFWISFHLRSRRWKYVGAPLLEDRKFLTQAWTRPYQLIMYRSDFAFIKTWGGVIFSQPNPCLTGESFFNQNCVLKMRETKKWKNGRILMDLKKLYFWRSVHHAGKILSIYFHQCYNSNNLIFEICVFLGYAKFWNFSNILKKYKFSIISVSFRESNKLALPSPQIFLKLRHCQLARRKPCRENSVGKFYSIE